jgi:hypothetical protein
MPVPRKLLQAAFATLPEKTLRRAAEHHDLRGRDALSAAELAERLGRDDGTRLQSITPQLSLAELKKIAEVFAVTALRPKKSALEFAVWSFVQNYDRNRPRPEEGRQALKVRDVFARAGSAEFGKALWNWTEPRYGQLGYDGLTPGEQLLWRVRWLLLEINGNSFPGFFENTPDDWPEQVLDDLKRIGAKQSAAALRKIGKMLFPSGVPPRQAERQDALVLEGDEAEERFEEVLDECRALWEKAGEDIPALSAAFAARHPKLFGA